MASSKDIDEQGQRGDRGVNFLQPQSRAVPRDNLVGDAMPPRNDQSGFTRSD
jgi:hypothetical protein